jgi:hypothetical protein
LSVARLTLSRGYFGLLDPVDDEVLAILDQWQMLHDSPRHTPCETNQERAVG